MNVAVGGLVGFGAISYILCAICIVQGTEDLFLIEFCDWYSGDDTGSCFTAKRVLQESGQFAFSVYDIKQRLLVVKEISKIRIYL